MYGQTIMLDLEFGINVLGQSWYSDIAFHQMKYGKTWCRDWADGLYNIERTTEIMLIASGL